MGLDNYAVYGKDHNKYDHKEGADNSIPDYFFPDNKLCGGMSSSGGNSFRGKVYAEVVEYFTGYSLYEDILEPQDVNEIHDMLSKVTEEKFLREFNEPGFNTWNIKYEELVDLTKWFGVVVSESGCVVSWY